MAYASTQITARFDIVARLRSAAAEATEAWTRYRTFRTTLSELEGLNDRELQDLGLSRSGLRAVAHESAYGK